VRDILLRFAWRDCYTAKWSRHITDEWQAILERKGVSSAEINKRISRPQSAFPNALVEHYEQLIPTVTLPDENDRHVVAAAVKVNANRIVTWNLKDFPTEELQKFGLEAISPDDFLVDLIDLDEQIAIEVFNDMYKAYKSPAYSQSQLIERLRKNKLKSAADYFYAII
jgi:predicted nucleic acid-binding protein